MDTKNIAHKNEKTKINTTFTIIKVKSQLRANVKFMIVCSKKTVLLISGKFNFPNLMGPLGLNAYTRSPLNAIFGTRKNSHHE